MPKLKVDLPCNVRRKPFRKRGFLHIRKNGVDHNERGCWQQPHRYQDKAVTENKAVTEKIWWPGPFSLRHGRPCPGHPPPAACAQIAGDVPASSWPGLSGPSIQALVPRQMARTSRAMTVKARRG